MANGAPGRAVSHDIVLWGASGYTGQVVAEYLAERLRGSELRWALGGRSRGKLEQLREQLGAIDPEARELPILVGDSHDTAWLAELAATSRVVCTTVGPYAKYGSELVAACARAGTDYCDLTGEAPWIRQMIDAHHDEALASGARVVTCCGYDSIPADLGCLMVQEHMGQHHGGRCHRVGHYLGATKGSLSGGTVASMMEIMAQMRGSAEVRRLMADPYSLNPEGERHGPDGPDDMGVRFDEEIRTWTGLSLMANIDTRIVRRSNALLDFRYGRDFRYTERSSYPTGIRGWAMAARFTASLGMFAAAMALPPSRRLLQRFVLPKPGDGPTRAEREQGYFKVRLAAQGRDEDGTNRTLRGRVEGTSDPGYGETAKMLGESAICLAEERSADQAGGVLTPAVAMGMELVERLRRAGMTFEVTDGV